MVELELSFSCVVQRVKIFSCGLLQRVRADDVGLDELARTVDGAVHVAFGGKVHHVRRFELGEHAVKLVFVADVDLLKLEPGRLRDRCEVFKIACVGELVHHANKIRRVVDDVPDNCRTDEPGSAGDSDASHVRYHEISMMIETDAKT